MKLKDVIRRPNLDAWSLIRAYKMLNRMKQIKKRQKKEQEESIGWNVDPHQGSHNGIGWR